MGAVEWVLEVVLLGLLALTIQRSLRLERALEVLRRDRMALERLIDGFGDNTKRAEDGAERLRLVAEGAGKQIMRQVEKASTLRDDLEFLAKRGGHLADRLEDLLRNGRADLGKAPTASATVRSAADTASPATVGEAAIRSKAERDLLRVLGMGR